MSVAQRVICRLCNQANVQSPEYSDNECEMVVLVQKQSVERQREGQQKNEYEICRRERLAR